MTASASARQFVSLRREGIELLQSLSQPATAALPSPDFRTVQRGHWKSAAANQAACDKIIAYKDDVRRKRRIDSLVNLFTFFRCDMGKPNGNTHQRKDRDNFEVHPVTVFADSPMPF
jgi:hypothetical protein